MNIFKVHLVNEGTRGATLETIVSRMKMISKNVNVYIYFYTLNADEYNKIIY